MASTALSEIQTALYSLLMPGGTLDPTLASLGVTGVFDFQGVPENQPFDYITLGDAQEGPANTFGRRGYLDTVHLHIWSRQRGTKNADAMLSRLNDLIDEQPLPLATQSLISCMYDMAQHVLDPDGLTLHVVVRYLIMTQH